MRPKLIQKPWSKLLTQVDDGWSEHDHLPFSQWKDKTEIEGLEKQIKEVTVLINQISEDAIKQEASELGIGQEETWEIIMWMDNVDVDILEHVQNESSFDEEVKMTPQRIKHIKAIRSFEVCLKWAEENAESENHILILSEMKKKS